MAERISPNLIETAKRADLVDLIGRHVKLRRRGKAHWGCCPFHKERSPSFKVEGERYKCFGCGKSGDAIEWVRESQHLAFDKAVEYLTGPKAPARFCGMPIRQLAEREKDDARRRAESLKIWDRGAPLAGTHAEAYLRQRGIRRPPSDQLRYHPALWHSEFKREFPALLGKISNDAGFCAVQRIYLEPERPARLPGKEAKLSLGPMEDGAVRLRVPRERLGLAEGIETAESAAQIYATPTWAVLGAQRLGKIAIPPQVRQIIIFADAGDIGRTEAFAAQDRYEARGFIVEVITPQAHHKPSSPASDFNDILRGQPDG